MAKGISVIYKNTRKQVHLQVYMHKIKSWMSVVTPTDHPKLVRNRCVIEVFGGVFVSSIGCWIFCWYKGFRHRLSQISVFFSSSLQYDFETK